VVSFTPRSLYPRGKRPWYPLDKRLGGPRSQSGRGGEEKSSHHYPCHEWNPRRLSCSLVTTLTELPRLQNNVTIFSFVPYLFRKPPQVINDVTEYADSGVSHASKCSKFVEVVVGISRKFLNTVSAGSLDNKIRRLTGQFLYFFPSRRSQWPRDLRHVLSSTSRILGTRVRIPIGTWMCVCVFLCCVVLCRKRPCVGLTPRPRSPTKCP
jgi:hypothetical protein